MLAGLETTDRVSHEHINVGRTGDHRPSVTWTLKCWQDWRPKTECHMNTQMLAGLETTDRVSHEHLNVGRTGDHRPSVTWTLKCWQDWKPQTECHMNT